MPGSHVRPNTAAENRQLGAIPHTYAHGQMPQSDERHTPLPGGVPVDLKAGDGVVYANMLLHWGSNYGTRHRRIIHIGTRGFGGPRHYAQSFWTEESWRYLAPEKQEEQKKLLARYDQERAAKASTLRAILDRDQASFSAGLTRLHPALALLHAKEGVY